MLTLETTDTLTEREVAALIADAPASVPEAFCPADAPGVDWVLRKVAAARAEAALIRENAERMARACERDADTLEWKYGAAIQTWARAEIGDGKKKSIRLFHGVVGFRTRPACVSIADPAAALAHAKAFLPEAVTETLDKKALTARLLETGEALPWASFQPAEDVFYMR